MDVGDIKKFEDETWKDFNNAISLMGVIPLLAFGYLLAERLMIISMLPLERAFVTVMALLVFILGLAFGRQIIKRLVTNVMEFNRKVREMENEVIEKNRLSAVSQTVLALSHEINNPLMVVLGNIEFLDDKVRKAEMLTEHEKLAIMKDSCKKIKGMIENMDSMGVPEPVSGDAAKPAI